MTDDESTTGLGPREFPHVRVKGGPHERGLQYGEQARDRVALSLQAYEHVFAYYTGWDWSQVRQAALPYIASIEAAFPSYLEEMRGMANGSGVDFEDILALNIRTEIMYSAEARKAALGRTPSARECSSFLVMPEASASGDLLAGENWDWLPHCLDTVVVLEASQEQRPNYVTVVEAGLLAKAGMNSVGFCLATNALVTDQDRGVPGIPYHVLLRALLDVETMTEALERVQKWTRSSSANYLLAHEDGIGIDAEAAPGDFTQVYFLMPSGGMLVHTNHFLSQLRDVNDVSLWSMPDSLVRLQRLRDALETARPVSVQALESMLGDHADYPFGVCSHADLHKDPAQQGATIPSIIMNPRLRKLWLADGHPCSTPYRELDYGDFLSRPAHLLDQSGVVDSARRRG